VIQKSDEYVGKQADYLKSHLKNNNSLFIEVDLASTNGIIKMAAKEIHPSLSIRVMNAYDLIRDYLADDEKQVHSAVREGFLFLLAGYADMVNRKLSEVFKYTLLERARLKKPTWVFIPVPLENMGVVWGVQVHAIVQALCPKEPNRLIQMLNNKFNLPIPTVWVGDTGDKK